MNVTHDGCSFAFEIRGSGPPVILIQGVGAAGSAWRPQVDRLADEFSCLTFDNRGFGNSQPLGAPLSVERMADDTLAIMTAAGWQSAHVMGHSLGGLIALHVARKAPERVRSLSLMCTFADGRIATRMTPWILWVGIRSRIGPRAWRRRAFMQLVLSARRRAAADLDAYAIELADLFGHDLADQPPVAMKQFAAMRNGDATAFLSEIRTPTLVISAEEDRIAPPFAGRAIAEGIPGARYIEIEDASHGVTIQEPDRINALLLEHLRAADNAHASHIQPMSPITASGE